MEEKNSTKKKYDSYEDKIMQSLQAALDRPRGNVKPDDPFGEDDEDGMINPNADSGFTLNDEEYF